MDDLVTLLVEHGVGLKPPQPSGVTWLQAAARKRNVKMMRILVQSGADPEHTSEGHMTTLAAAVVEGFSDGVEFLLRFGSSPNTCVDNSTKQTALMFAAEYGINDILQKLIAAGGDMRGAPQAAVKGNQLHALQILMTAGADIEAVGRDHPLVQQAAKNRTACNQVR